MLIKIALPLVAFLFALAGSTFIAAQVAYSDMKSGERFVALDIRKDKGLKAYMWLLLNYKSHYIPCVTTFALTVCGWTIGIMNFPEATILGSMTFALCSALGLAISCVRYQKSIGVHEVEGETNSKAMQWHIVAQCAIRETEGIATTLIVGIVGTTAFLWWWSTL